MALMDLVTVPLRVGVAATQVTLALGELVAPDGPVRREGGYAERLMAVGGVLDRLLQEEGLLDRLLAEDGTLERLTAEGGTLDQLVALGETLEAIAPRLAELGAVVPELHRSVDTLNDAVGPLGELAGRLPRTRRRAAIEA